MAVDLDGPGQSLAANVVDPGRDPLTAPVVFEIEVVAGELHC